MPPIRGSLRKEWLALVIPAAVEFGHWVSLHRDTKATGTSSGLFLQHICADRDCHAFELHFCNQEQNIKIHFWVLSYPTPPAARIPCRFELDALECIVSGIVLRNAAGEFADTYPEGRKGGVEGRRGRCRRVALSTPVTSQLSFCSRSWAAAQRAHSAALRRLEW